MYRVIISDHFKKQIKRYIKKYPHFKEDIFAALKSFNKQQSIYIGNNLYKLRFKSSDIHKGKSKSFRAIVLLVEIEDFITPIAVYFKGDKEDITRKEINEQLGLIIWELKLKT